MLNVKSFFRNLLFSGRINHVFVLCAFLFFSQQLVAQDKSNRGREFWLGYGYNYYFNNESPVNNQTLAIYISAEEAATVTVSVNSTGWSQTVSIPANSVNFSIAIPKSGVDDARILAEGLSTKGIHIVSDVPVVVYAHQYYVQLSGATMLMPVETFGYTYYSINYDQSNSNIQDWYSWFFVVASEDNTRLQITPSDTTQGGWIKGQTYTVNLNKGEIYNVFGKAEFNGLASGASKDMTGSKIVSITGADGTCHPVGVFSGSSGIRLCNGDGGEFMHQQVFPANAWGTRYLTYHTLNNFTTNVTLPNLNFYRIAVQDPATVVKKNGVTLTGLINNFYYEYTSTSGDYITADKPILVAQYMTNLNQCTGNTTTGYGDPEMFYLSPIEQGLKKALFYNSRNYGIDFNYVNILLPTAGVSSLLADGIALPAASIIAHPTYPGYSVAVARLTGPGAQHRITCDSTFTATVYGLGLFESYGYNVGCMINNLNAYSSIKNTFNTSGITDTFTCLKTQVKFFIKTAYPLTNIHWKLSQAGGGMSPNTDSVIANPVPLANGTINGRTYYTYTLRQDFTFASSGTYYIPVTYQSPSIDNCNNTETASIKVVVKPGPSTDFTVSAQNCLSDSIHFTGLPVSGGFNIINYTWSFDDNSTINTINAVKKFTVAGNQNIRYRIFADNGCTGDTTKVVNIAESPIAKFGFTNNICSGDSVHFTDTSAVATGSIISWSWNFGDGNTALNTNGNPFNHHYATAGNFMVSLVVTSGNGCKSDTLKRLVTVLPKPFAKFGFDKNVCLGQSILFSDSSGTASGSINQWGWNYGDGNTQVRINNAPFSYTYTTTGNFVVSLATSGSNGCLSDTFRLTVNVSNRPSSGFTTSGKPCADSSQQFISATPFNSTIPSNWYWDFGDGQNINITTTNEALHAYAIAGINIVIRHAVTVGGCLSDTTDNIIAVINPNPTADFLIESDTLCENLPVRFSGSGSSDIGMWVWDFGNGTGSNVPPFSRLYNSAGNYSVKMFVQTAAGCGSAPVIKPLNIAVAPVINAGPDIYMRPGDSKRINATISNPSAYNYLWTPADYLNAADILNPVTAAIDPIVYKVMAVDKTNACISYDSVAIFIVTDIYVPNAFTPNNDGLNDVWGIPALQLYPEAHVVVYNRYSQKIFESTGYGMPWDGTFKGELQPMGSYVYIITPSKNSVRYFKGTVTIIR